MRYAPGVLVLASAILATACGATNGPTTPTPRGAADATIRSVVPSGGATGVDPAAPITIVFNHPMMPGMEMLVVLHEGSVTGAEVAGSSAWSSDRTRLTFTPAALLASRTSYVLHFSPNLKDASGAAIDWPACASGVGGTAANAGMFGGGMMGGGMGAGMMGSGWQPGSGTWGYGMLVTFTTA